MKLTDALVIRVMEILNERTWSSLDEVTARYNQKFPPWRIGKIQLPGIAKSKVLSALRYLKSSEYEYVRSEQRSFTTVPESSTHIEYGLTQKGVQYLGERPRRR